MAIPTTSKAGTANLEIEKGATFDPFIHWADGDGVGIDIAPVGEIRMQVRSDHASGDILEELTTGNGKIINGAATAVMTAAKNNEGEVAEITAAGVITIDPAVFGAVDFVAAGVEANDVIALAGTDSNDGDGFGHLVISVDSPIQITVNPLSRAGGLFPNALVNELSGNGTISITRDGQFQLVLTAAETALLAWSEGVYDIEIVDGATVVRIIEGSILVSPEVTR